MKDKSLSNAVPASLQKGRSYSPVEHRIMI